MFLIHTNEVTVDFVGHPMRTVVTDDVRPVVDGGERAPGSGQIARLESDAEVSTVEVEAATRDDGAVGGTLRLRGTNEALRLMAEEVLRTIGPSS